MDDYAGLAETESTLVLLANENEDIPEANSYIMVSRYDADEGDEELLALDDEAFLEEIQIDGSHVEAASLAIDGVPVKEITCTVDESNLYRRTYYYVANQGFFRVDMLCSVPQSSEFIRFFDAVMDSYTITVFPEPIEEPALSPTQYIQMVTGGYRIDDPEFTYGDAFNSFFSSPHWEFFISEDDEKIVEFTGDCTYRDTPVTACIQFVIYDDTVYVIEVNPRSSRTIPYISKVTGVPIIDLATKVMLGQKLKDLGYGTGIYKEADYYAVKMPVFSFEKLTDVDTGLGPEMKSTGECFKGANLKAPKKGGRMIITVKDEDKEEIIGIARGFYDMGIEILATSGTCKVLNEAGIPARWVARVSEAHPNILDMIASGSVDLVINTPTRGRKHSSDGFKIRRSAVEHSVPCVTAIDTARAVLTVREQSRSVDLTPIDITKI